MNSVSNQCLCIYFSDCVQSATGVTSRLKGEIHKRHQRFFQKMNQRRDVHRLLSWLNNPKDTDNRTKESTLRIINDRYREFTSYGKLSYFYRYGLHKSTNLDIFRTINRKMSSLRSKWSQNGKVKIAIHQDFKYTSYDNMKERKIRQMEAILEFEHTMRTLQLKVCKSCREYKLQLDDVVVVDRNKNAQSLLQVGTQDATNLIVCKDCTRKGYISKTGKDYYMDSNLLPVWFERNSDGTFKLDHNGQKLIRYDIPNELNALTMAEKLLIRRCAPFVPLVHIDVNVPGLQGHCICYPQNITELCRELPNRKEEIITFVRKVGGHDTKRLTSHIDAFKVRKSKVLAALHWLKIHHIHYHDITISPSNLDWMNGAEIARIPLTVEEHSFAEDTDNTNRIPTLESVSVIQTEVTGNIEDEMEYRGITPSSTPFTPSTQQERAINKIKNTFKNTTSGEGIMTFPPTDNYDPIS